jgi:heme exporter protein B
MLVIFKSLTKAVIILVYTPSVLKEIKALLYKELLFEWRNQAAIMGIMLYVICSVFVVSLFFREGINSSLWIALFWLLMLFIGVNTIAKSFMGETRGQRLYLYQLASSTSVIIAKSIYNILVLLFLGGAAFLIFSFFLGLPQGEIGLLLGVVCLGNIGIAGSLTLISGITALAGAQTGLMAILSFPILLPQLLMSIRLSTAALNGVLMTNYFWGLIFMILLLQLLSTLLFPYLWRE